MCLHAKVGFVKRGRYKNVTVEPQHSAFRSQEYMLQTVVLQNQWSEGPVTTEVWVNSAFGNDVALRSWVWFAAEIV